MRHGVFTCLAVILGTKTPIAEIDQLLTSRTLPPLPLPDYSATRQANSLETEEHPDDLKGQRLLGNATNALHTPRLPISAIRSEVLHSDSRPASPAATQQVGLLQLLIGLAWQRLSGEPTPDAMSVLSKAGKNYKAALRLHWLWGSTEPDSLAYLIISSLQANVDKDPAMTAALLALKVLEEWTKADTSELTKPVSPVALVQRFLQGDSSAFFTLEGSLDLFSRTLPDLLLAQSQPHAPTQLSSPDPRAAIRTKVLSCLSYLPYSQWGLVPLPLRARMLQLLLAATRDQVAAVRAAACRCLGVYTVYYTCSDGVLLQLARPHDAGAEARPDDFVARAARVLLSLVDKKTESVLSVRVRACWAIANLCDYNNDDGDNEEDATCEDDADEALSRPSQGPEEGQPLQTDQQRPSPAATEQGIGRPPLQQFLPRPLLLHLVACSVAATQGNPKVVANAVRAIGNISRWLPLGTDIGNDSHPLWCKICTVLRDSLGPNKSVKARWNACYAIGNLFRNPNVPSILKTAEGAKSVSEVLHALGQTMADHSSANFKVRINAAAALAAAPSRLHYGASFSYVLGIVADSLRRFQHEQVDNFKEFKYRDTLRSQLLMSLLHLLRLWRRQALPRDPALREIMVSKISFFAEVAHKERTRLDHRAYARTTTLSTGDNSDTGTADGGGVGGSDGGLGGNDEGQNEERDCVAGGMGSGMSSLISHPHTADAGDAAEDQDNPQQPLDPPRGPLRLFLTLYRRLDAISDAPPHDLASQFAALCVRQNEPVSTASRFDPHQF